MEIRQIELFVAAAEEQHFTKAAERCNIVQSGLSSAIRALEEELGASLFIRSTRRVELSPAGEVFLPEARRILSAIRAAQRSIKDVKSGVAGRIVVSMAQSLVPAIDIPGLLHAFKAAHPNVEIGVRETRPSDLRMELRRGSVDVAFMPSYGLNDAGLDVVPVVSSPMVVVGAADHALVGRRSIPIAAIADEPFVDVSTRWGLRRLVDQVFLHQGLQRSTAFELDDVDLLLEFVERGFGLAMVPEAMVKRRSIAALDVILDEGGFPRWEFGMFSVKQKGKQPSNPVADLFKDVVLQSLGSRHGSG